MYVNRRHDDMDMQQRCD